MIIISANNNFTFCVLILTLFLVIEKGQKITGSYYEMIFQPVLENGEETVPEALTPELLLRGSRVRE